jgi:hypothetical protein
LIASTLIGDIRYLLEVFMPYPRRRKRRSDGDVLELLHCIVQKLDRMEDRFMSALDDAVTGLTTEVDRVLTDVVQDLRDKLAQAQADDASAAEVAADVAENVQKLDDLRAHVSGFEPPASDPAEPAPPTDDGGLPPAEPTA